MLDHDPAVLLDGRHHAVSADIRGKLLCTCQGTTEVLGLEVRRSIGTSIVQDELADREETEAAVLEHCRETLAAYKVPKSVRFVDELPKSPVGKVLRKDLKAQAAAESTRS